MEASSTICLSHCYVSRAIKERDLDRLIHRKKLDRSIGRLINTDMIIMKSTNCIKNELKSTECFYDGEGLKHELLNPNPVAQINSYICIYIYIYIYIYVCVCVCVCVSVCLCEYVCVNVLT